MNSGYLSLFLFPAPTLRFSLISCYTHSADFEIPLCLELQQAAATVTDLLTPLSKLLFAHSLVITCDTILCQQQLELSSNAVHVFDAAVLPYIQLNMHQHPAMRVSPVASPACMVAILSAILVLRAAIRCSLLTQKFIEHD